MILDRCLTIDEAYEDVDWSVIFLLARMIPLRIAFERSEGTRLLAEGRWRSWDGSGPWPWDSVADVRTEVLRLLRDDPEVREAIFDVLARDPSKLLALVQDERGREKLDRPTL